MSGNERIRMVPSVNSRLPTCAPCEFNGDWSWRLYGLCWRCNALHSCESLVCEERLKWQQSQANAADRDDRVESVRNRVYSIIYRCSISMQFVGVHLLLLRVNRVCETNRSMTVDDNLDELLEATMVELSGLRIDRNRVRLVTVGREVEQTSAVVRASEERLVERRVTSSIGELLQRVVGGNHEPFGVGPDAVPLQLSDEGVPVAPDLNLLFQLAEPAHTGVIEDDHGLSAVAVPPAVHGLHVEGKAVA